MHYPQNWACGDFDLFEFIGTDDPNFDQQYSGETSANGDHFNGNGQFDLAKDDLSLEKQDQMYTTLQYNDMLVNPDNRNNMYGNVPRNGMMPEEMGTAGYMQDDRYLNTSGSSNTGSLLNSTVNKLYQQQQQQQHQNQPSTSRLSGVGQPQQQNYNTRMRPQMATAQPTQIGQQTILNGDLAENALLPTSSTSPLNANGLYLPTQQQTIVKNEPTNYEMFDSTSDNESHYSHAGSSITGVSGSGSKPRKYRIKPETERQNPQYRMKRAKNNDAVRRSREKAKHQQLEKEKRLQFLETQHNEQIKKMYSLQQRVRELEAINQQISKNCSCGAAGGNRMFQR